MTGEIVEFQPSAYAISESIDKALRDETAEFLMNGVVAMKSTQAVAEQFGITIGCLFTKPAKFEDGVTALTAAGHHGRPRLRLPSAQIDDTHRLRCATPPLSQASI